MSRRRRRNDWIPGAVITIIVIMLSVVFMGLLAMTKMVPTIYMLIIGIVLAVIAAIIWLLVWHTRYTGRFIGGTVLAVIMIAILHSAVSILIRQDPPSAIFPVRPPRLHRWLFT